MSSELKEQYTRNSSVTCIDLLVGRWNSWCWFLALRISWQHNSHKIQLSGKEFLLIPTNTHEHIVGQILKYGNSRKKKHNFQVSRKLHISVTQYFKPNFSLAPPRQEFMQAIPSALIPGCLKFWMKNLFKYFTSKKSKISFS